MRQTHTAQTPPISKMLGLQDKSQWRKPSPLAPLQQKGQTHLVSRFYYKPIAPSCAEVSELLWLGWLETNCSAALDLQISSPAAGYGKAYSIVAAICWGLLRVSNWWTNLLCKTEYYWLPSFCGSPGSLFCTCDFSFLLNSNNMRNFVESLGGYSIPQICLARWSWAAPFLGFLGGQKVKHR